jgi:hypothetical protein
VSKQFLMKSGTVAFTSDFETLIIKQRGVVETALPKNKEKAERKLSRLIRAAQR